MTCSFIITHETSAHLAEIEAIHETVFGPGRFARTAFRVREGILADPDFCFVAMEDETVAGSVRLTKVAIGEEEAYLLGPLCVADPKQGGGIGKALVKKHVKLFMKNMPFPSFWWVMRLTMHRLVLNAPQTVSECPAPLIMPDYWSHGLKLILILKVIKA